jgi:hypothetical protein
VKKEVIHDLNKRYKKHVASDEIGQWMDKGVKMAYLKNLVKYWSNGIQLAIDRR